MKRKTILSVSLLIFLFAFLIFFYFKSNYEKDLIEKKKAVKLVEKDNIETCN